MLLRRMGKEKNKQNIKNRKYGQVKFRPSRRGIYSCLFAFGCIICLAVLIGIAYTTYGQASALIGSIGLVTIINAGWGIYYGIVGFRERERNYISCKIGIGMNGFIIVLFLLLFVRGLF